MGDCTSCQFDTETLNCKQGHMREWHHETGSEKGWPIPIQDCHAWKEKEECSCKRFINTPAPSFMVGVQSLFKLTCKKCGRVIK